MKTLKKLFLPLLFVFALSVTSCSTPSADDVYNDDVEIGVDKTKIKIPGDAPKDDD